MWMPVTSRWGCACGTFCHVDGRTSVFILEPVVVPIILDHTLCMGTGAHMVGQADTWHEWMPVCDHSAGTGGGWSTRFDAGGRVGE